LSEILREIPEDISYQRKKSVSYSTAYGDIEREATTTEVKELREENELLKQLVAEIIYVMGFQGLTRPEIFSRLEAVQQSDWSDNGIHSKPEASPHNRQRNDGTANNGKYIKASLTSVQSGKIRRNLILLMETEMPFREPELTLHELLRRLSVSSNHLSQVINGRRF